MPTRQGSEDEFWLVRLVRRPGRSWWLIAPLLFAGLGAGSYLLQDAFGSLGNTTSILGLLISLVGFVFTIWTVLDTQRTTRESEKRIEEAVRAGRRETREAVAKIAWQLLREDCTEIYTRLTQARLMTRQQPQQWFLALDRCEQVRAVCQNLLNSEFLTLEEKRAVEEGAVGINGVIRYVEQNRLGVTGIAAAQPLPRKHSNVLDTFLISLERIAGRLRRIVVEIPHDHVN